jgi:hypothetical protein
MTALRPLPARLQIRPFTVSEATDVSRSRLRPGDLARPFHGARIPVTSAADHTSRCAAAVLVCNDRAFVCRLAAAAYHRMPLPTAPTERTPIDIGMPAPLRAVRRRGIRGHSLIIVSDDVMELDGVRITTPERTWCDLAEYLTVPELVAAGDWLLRSGTSSAARLAAAIERYPGRRGRGKLVVAVELLDAASESPKESELRAIVILAGLPRPEANTVIHDERGQFVARVDLLFRRFGEVLEYHGDQHRTDRKQWRRDRTREAELESLGLHVMEITDADLRRPRELVTRIARNLRRRGWNGTAAFSAHFPSDRAHTHPPTAN